MAWVVPAIGAVASFLGGQSSANAQKRALQSQQAYNDYNLAARKKADSALWNIYTNPNTPFYQSQLRDIEGGINRQGMAGAQNIFTLLGQHGIGNSLQAQNMQVGLQGQLGQAMMQGKLAALNAAQQRSTNALEAYRSGVSQPNYMDLASTYGTEANNSLGEIGQLLQLYMMNRKLPKVGFGGEVNPKNSWGNQLPDMSYLFQ